MFVQVAPFAELTTSTLYAILRLRCDVFVVEQRCPYPELDGRDSDVSTRHIFATATSGGPPIAYLRILTELDGSARIGRVCVVANHRRRGLAAALIRRALAEIGPGRRCVLDAQESVVDLYRGLGFSIAGPRFVEDGIPHVPMCRPGAAPTATTPATAATPPAQ